MAPLSLIQGESKKRPSNLKSKYLSNHLSHRYGSALETNVWMPPLRLYMSQYSRMHIAGEIKQKLRHIGGTLEPLSYWWPKEKILREGL